MSRFFVGQRVRFVRPMDWLSPHAGRAGVIVELAEDAPSEIRLVNCRLDWTGDCWLHTDQLEPILMQDNRACDDEFKRDLDKLLEGLPA